MKSNRVIRLSLSKLTDKYTAVEPLYRGHAL